MSIREMQMKKLKDGEDILLKTLYILSEETNGTR